MRAPDPSPLPGQVVRVNDRVCLHNVETGRLLMSDLRLVNTGFGVECRTYAEVLGPGGEVRSADLGDENDAGDGRLCAVWSFVNETWADQVAEVKANLTGGHEWKEDEGDDFERSDARAVQEADPVEFCALEGPERKLLEDQHMLLSQNPCTTVCQRRIFPALRSRGVHFIRTMRKMCEESDVLGGGFIPARTFEGILAARVIRLTPLEFDDICEAFDAGILSDDEVTFLDYRKFFWFLEGFFPEQRLDSVRRAYRKLQGVARARFVTVKTLMVHWNPESSREVQDGSMDHKEACQEFIAQWEANNAEGHISPEEFLRYYRDVSLCYEDGDEFLEMLKVAWDL